MSKKNKQKKDQSHLETDEFSVGSPAPSEKTEKNSKEKELFLKAVEIEDRKQRLDFLREACREDRKLLQDVVGLIAESEGDSEFIIDRALFPEDSLVDRFQRKPGEQVGAYTLMQLLGLGGMGEVWLANQTQPVRRKVALKLVREGRESPGVLQRFESERQALASMQHPNIATVLDASKTSTGQPFFVMELVNGAPLTEFCDEGKFTIRQRLEVYSQVLNAVAHAHRKAIIHRDLKPSNVLVTVIDGQPVPKVIDFGLAKVLTGNLTTDSLSTQFGAVLGTLEYMSPEQAGYSGQDVDTRADVYSLGVILYELITGLRPFDSNRFKDAPLDEMLRVIKEVEPSIPSARLSTSESATKNASLRCIGPDRLSNLLKNELDWIVMKAIDKDRSRRYQSVGEFAADINSYLVGDPVTAHPPSPAYRLRKFVGKNKGLVASMASIATALLLGISGTTYGLIKSNANAHLLAIEVRKSIDAEELAVKEKADAIAARNAAIAATEEEKRQRKFAEAITDFVKSDILALTTVHGQYRFKELNSDADIPTVIGKDATLKQLLDRAGKKLLARDDLEPLAAAELYFVLGVSYRQVGEYKLAIEFLERSVRIRETELGLNKVPTLNSLNSLAVAYELDGELESARGTYEKTLAACQGFFGESIYLTAKVMSNFAGHLLEDGNAVEARSLSNRALEIAESNLADGHPVTIDCLVTRANVLSMDREWEDGCKLYERALQYRKNNSGGDFDLATLELMNTLGHAYIESRQFEKAIKVLRECYECRLNVLGEGDPGTMTTCSYLTNAYSRTGQFMKAAPLLEASLKLHLERYGKDHRLTHEAINSLAIACFRNREYTRSLELSLDVVEKRKQDFGEDHPTTLAIMNNIVLIRRELNQYDQAIEACNEVLGIVKKKYGDDHVKTLDVLHDLARIYAKSERYDDAIEIKREVVEKTEAKLGSEHTDTLALKRSLAYTYRFAGDYDQAIPIYKSIAASFEKKLGPSHSETISCLNGVANCNLLAENFDEAVSVYQQMLNAIESTEGSNHRHFIMVVSNYAHALVRTKKFAKAIALFETSLESAMERWGENHPQTIKIMGDLARANFEAGNADKSLALFDDALTAAKCELGDDHDLTIKLSQHLEDTLEKVEATKNQAGGKNGDEDDPQN